MIVSLSTKKLRVIKRKGPEAADGVRQETVPSALAPDSLGWSLLLAARLLARVDGGQSLTEALALLDGQIPAARAAALDVVYGSLRQFGRLEFLLGRLMSKPLSHRETEGLLRAALYRLESRPEASHTVVDQAVKASGELASGVFKGLVNGVLRNYLRQRESLLSALANDEVARYQHPRWWLERLRRGWPQQWEEIVAADNTPPPMTLRVNRRKGSVAEYLASLATASMSAQPVGDWGVRLEHPVPVDALPGFFDGRVSVQDLGAQRAAALLAPANGMRVLDACAAPGGKSAHLLESADIDLLALDVDAARARRISDTLRRLELTARVAVGDAAQPADWWDGRAFDAILADVPCSASGVVRRHPDIKSLRRESDIRKFARTQALILDALWPLLKPGGRLVYATCSVFAEENAGQIDAFLVRQSGASRISQEQWLPCVDSDGFYYAVLEKNA